MRLPERLFEKAYFFLFTWLCLGELSALLLPQSEPYIYYRTLWAFHPPAGIFYILAIARGIVTMICLIALYNYAFNVPRRWDRFFKPLLFLRVVLDVTGHNYEMQFLKTLSHFSLLMPLAALSVWIGITFLSYKAHFLSAFCLPRNTKQALEAP
ncbi:MAG: hypothetical protein HQL20_07590 [Candidatus Omnitrophica bacterium]|nr:hypothetical protein [Candidatus Omnitrophota bacterium]